VGNSADKIASRKSPPSLPASNHVLPSGESAKYSGIYKLEHPRKEMHQAEKEIFIPQGTVLPSCNQCACTLQYKLVRRVDYITEDPDFQ
jgi:hypothetical protein